jgi:tetratricopeptide (TPR) repeat protein
MIPGYPDDVRYAFDSREVAMLPNYCKYTQLFRDGVPGGNNKAEIDKWYRIMGHTFHAMHHYCWGLMKTNRALLLARNQQTRTFYLRSGIDEFDYVLRRAPPDFVMLPEILTKKGENLIKLGYGEKGVMELQSAIAAKQDYWPPYADLSDYYKGKGDVGKARDILEKALTFAPDEKALTRRLGELGGAGGKKETAAK